MFPNLEWFEVTPYFGTKKMLIQYFLPFIKKGLIFHIPSSKSLKSTSLILEYLSNFKNYYNLTIIIDIIFDCFENIDDTEQLTLICNHYNKIKLFIKIRWNLLNDITIILNKLKNIKNKNDNFNNNKKEIIQICYMNDIVDNYAFLSLNKDMIENKSFVQFYHDEIIYPTKGFSIN